MTDQPQSLFHTAGLPYFLIAFIARLPFAMNVVGVLTVVVSARDSLSLGGLTAAAVGVGTAVFGPLLGAAADRFGQRIVLTLMAVSNAAMLVLFTLTVYADTPVFAVLLAGCAIGATAPQVAPMSRSRLVTIITERMAPERHARTISSTMAYESAADEIVFVFGPFVVGLVASTIAPWMPLVISAALTLLFVVAFALHPSGAHISAARGADGKAPSSAAELVRPALLVVMLGNLGMGLFFGAMLTSLTAFMNEQGEPEQAGLLYGVMGIGSGILALGVAWFPARFTLRARWLFFAACLFIGSLALLMVESTGGMLLALAFMGIGVGPTLVTQYSFGAARSPAGRSATVMTMLGSAVIVGQSFAAALTGEVAERADASAALLMPIAAAGIVLLAGALNWRPSNPHSRLSR